MKIIAIDPSLTATGIAHTHPTPSTHTIRTTGHKTDTLTTRTQRLTTITTTLTTHLQHHPHLAVIEAPAYGSNTGSTWDRAGNWWGIVHTIHAAHIPVLAIAPTTMKKFITGSGRAEKTGVAVAVTRLWGDLATPANDNEFDALALATMALVHYTPEDAPFPVLERHLQVTNKLDWPVL